jgi:hypothetical protein
VLMCTVLMTSTSEFDYNKFLIESAPTDFKVFPLTAGYQVMPKLLH